MAEIRDVLELDQDDLPDYSMIDTEPGDVYGIEFANLGSIEVRAE